MKIYIAGPLFTLAERRFNQELGLAIQELANDILVVLPQYETGKMAGSPDFVEKAFRFCLQSVDECDAVVGIFDGADADSGTCVEVGYAYARGKPIIGIRTDFRLSEDRGLNLMVANVCARLIMKSSLTANVSDVAREIVKNLKEIASK
jgi:nucleoside 2-deoxyribosyltransferase